MINSYPALRLWCLYFTAMVILFLAWHPVRHFAPYSDEGYYLHYTKVLGQAGFPGLAREIPLYLHNNAGAYHPLPIRIGYLVPAAVVSKMTGFSFQSLALVSMIAFLLLLGVSLYFSRRIFSKETAWIFLMLACSLSATLGMSRRALTDTLLDLTVTVSLWVFVLYLQKPLLKYFWTIVFFLTWSMLIKEGNGSLSLFFAGWVWMVERPAGRIKGYMALGLCVLPWTLAAVAWLAAFGANNWALVWRCIDVNYLHPPFLSQYAVMFCQGPWHKYAVDLLILDPLVLALAVAYWLSRLWSGQILKEERVFLAFAVFFYVALNLFALNKNVRYALPLEWIMALFAARWIVELRHLPGIKQYYVKAMLITALVFLTGFSQFYSVFYQQRLLDPITYHLMVLNKMFVPG